MVSRCFWGWNRMTLHFCKNLKKSCKFRGWVFFSIFFQQKKQKNLTPEIFFETFCFQYSDTWKWFLALFSTYIHEENIEKKNFKKNFGVEIFFIFLLKRNRKETHPRNLQDFFNFLQKCKVSRFQPQKHLETTFRVLNYHIWGKKKYLPIFFFFGQHFPSTL